jgi:hypothetical protein
MNRLVEYYPLLCSGRAQKQQGIQPTKCRIGWKNIQNHVNARIITTRKRAKGSFPKHFQRVLMIKKVFGRSLKKRRKRSEHHICSSKYVSPLRFITPGITLPKKRSLNINKRIRFKQRINTQSILVQEDHLRGKILRLRVQRPRLKKSSLNISIPSNQAKQHFQIWPKQKVTAVLPEMAVIWVLLDVVPCRNRLKMLRLL